MSCICQCSITGTVEGWNSLHCLIWSTHVPWCIRLIKRNILFNRSGSTAKNEVMPGTVPWPLSRNTIQIRIQFLSILRRQGRRLTSRPEHLNLRRTHLLTNSNGERKSRVLKFNSRKRRDIRRCQLTWRRHLGNKCIGALWLHCRAHYVTWAELFSCSCWYQALSSTETSFSFKITNTKFRGNPLKFFSGLIVAYVRDKLIERKRWIST